MDTLKQPVVSERPITPTNRVSEPNHPSLLSYSSAQHGNAATFHGTSPKHLIVQNTNSGMVLKPSHEVHSSITSIMSSGFTLARAAPTSAEQVSMQQWAHFSIPTPITMGGQGLEVASVWVRYANGSQARLRDCVLYDGEAQVAAWGPHPFTSHEAVSTEHLHVNDPTPVRHGLCLSVLIIFEGPFKVDGSGTDWLKLVAAGVDFVGAAPRV